LEVREEVRQLAQPLSEEEGFELVDVELAFIGRRKIVRVLLDKPGGVSVGDCARFSRKLSDCLDMNQTVPGSYMLEVSSPGIERPLRSLEAVARFSGQRAQMVLHEARDGRRHFEGVLLGPDGSRAGVRIDEGIECWFDWAEVRSARLIVDPWAGSRKGPRRDPRAARARGGNGGAGTPGGAA
jgi:ribosome maturation factor RimP